MSRVVDSPNKGPETMLMVLLALIGCQTNSGVVCDLRHHDAHMLSMSWSVGPVTAKFGIPLYDRLHKEPACAY